jgi:hypothetical protein
MYLLNTRIKQLEMFMGEDVPEYVVLSHIRGVIHRARGVGHRLAAPAVVTAYGVVTVTG